MCKRLHNCQCNSIQDRMENSHPTVLEIHILANGQTHKCRLGDNGQAHTCQMGRWHNVEQLPVKTIPQNWENMCRNFRDTCSGPWTGPYGPNGQVTITVHNYRCRQLQMTSNGKKSAQWLFRYPLVPNVTRLYGANGQIIRCFYYYLQV